MLSDQRRVVLVDGAPARSDALCAELARQGFSTERVAWGATPSDVGKNRVVAIIPPEITRDADQVELCAIIERLSNAQAPAIIWGASAPLALPSGSMIEEAQAADPAAEILGRIEALAHMAPLLRRAERDLSQMQRLSQQINRHFFELDQDLQMAGRLQRGFIPDQMPDAPPLKFARLFRPAAFVSGDIYDVFAIDDRHVGVFIADAMGHGTAAGFITMFLRRALCPIESNGKFYSIVPPAQIMTTLCQSLIDHKIPTSSFVTAAYATIDTRSLCVRCARGGHPFPILVRADGSIAEFTAEGGLLGVPEMQGDFEETELSFSSGDLLIFYTDGLEDMFVADREPKTYARIYADIVKGGAKLGADGFVQAVADRLDHQEGSLNPEDDITLVAIEATGSI